MADIKMGTMLYAGKVADKLDHSNIADANVKWYSYAGKPLPISLKPKWTWSYHPAITLLGIYPRGIKTCVHIKISTWMFIASLSIIAKTWKQMFFEGQITKQNMVIHIMEHKHKTLMNQRMMLCEKKIIPNNQIPYYCIYTSSFKWWITEMGTRLVVA